MPAPEVSDLKQKAVLWALNSHDDYGEVTVDAAAEISVRWETRKKETLDTQGNSVMTDALVVVDQVIAVGSIMWLGKLADVADPPVNLLQVIEYKEIPDIKAKEYRRTVSLIRYSNTLPTIAS